MTLDMGDEPGKLFVGGLSWETTVEKLTEYFCRYGEVTDCVVMKNAETGRSRGFGFVTFKDPTCVQLVMAGGPHSLDGRTIDPKECNPKSAQKGKRELKVGNFPKVFLGGLPANVNESVLRDYFAKYGKVMEVVIMYDQEKKKTRGFGFLSFDNEDTVDKVCADHYVSINGKQVEIKRAEPRDKQSGKSIGGSAMSNAMQPPGSSHMMAPMPPWGSAMWGPQPGPPIHVPPPPGQPPPPPQTGAPAHAMPNGIMPTGYSPAYAQQGTYATGNGWSQPPTGYQNYQGWAGYSYPPQGWTQGFSYGPYNTSYPGYGQSATAAAATANQAAVSQTPIASNTASSATAVGSYMQPTVATNLNSAQISNVASSTQQATGATMGSYSQDASNYGPSRGTYGTTNYNPYPMQGQGDTAASSATSYNASVAANPVSSYTRVASQAQYHPYRRV